MESSRRDFLGSALPAALIGIPLANTQEKQITHKFKLGQEFVLTNMKNANWVAEDQVYKIVGLISEKDKNGVRLSYRILPYLHEYDFVMTEESVSDGRFIVVK